VEWIRYGCGVQVRDAESEWPPGPCAPRWIEQPCRLTVQDQDDCNPPSTGTLTLLPRLAYSIQRRQSNQPFNPTRLDSFFYAQKGYKVNGIEVSVRSDNLHSKYKTTILSTIQRAHETTADKLARSAYSRTDPSNPLARPNPPLTIADAGPCGSLKTSILGAC
jgi:hypothetical protein